MTSGSGRGSLNVIVDGEQMPEKHNREWAGQSASFRDETRGRHDHELPACLTPTRCFNERRTDCRGWFSRRLKGRHENGANKSRVRGDGSGKIPEDKFSIRVHHTGRAVERRLSPRYG